MSLPALTLHRTTVLWDSTPGGSLLGPRGGVENGAEECRDKEAP